MNKRKGNLSFPEEHVSVDQESLGSATLLIILHG